MSGIADTLEKLAPTIATLVGGPFAGTAISALEGVFGLTPKPDDSVAARQAAVQAAMQTATPDQIIALKNADNALKTKMIDGGVQLEQIAASDRQSARDMEVKTGSRFPAVLMSLITLGFFGLLFYMAKYDIPAGNKDMMNIMLGSLGAAWVGGVTYYFGSSAGSSDKNSLLHKAMDAISSSGA